MSNISSLISNYAIFHEILRYFNFRHLYSCVLVSKDWNSIFIPHLWRNIDLEWNIDSDVLSRYQQHVVTLSSPHLISTYRQQIIQRIHFPKLQYLLKGRALYLERDDYPPYLPEVLNILPQTKFLNTLSLSIKTNTPQESIQKLPNTLNDLSDLRILNLYIQDECSLLFLQSIIHNCYQCTTFHLRISLDKQNISSDQIKDFIASIPESPEFQFKDLRINFLNLGQDLGIMVPLLQHSPKIETYYIYLPYTLESLQQITNILQHYPLKALGIEGDIIRDDSIYWPTIQTLLQKVKEKNCSHLNSTINTQSNMDSAILHFEATHGESAVFMGPIWEPGQSIQNTLPRFFSNDLSSLDLPTIEVKTFLLLLSQLPALRSVTISFLKPSNDVNTDLLSKPCWLCSGIRNLNIGILLFGDFVSFGHSDYTILFKIIGKLPSLEEFTFRCSGRMLTESVETRMGGFGVFQRGGHLIDLINLKRLCKVHLVAEQIFPISVKTFILEDITWIINNLTGLRHLVLTKPSISREQIPALLSLAMKNDVFIEILDMK